MELDLNFTYEYIGGSLPHDCNQKSFKSIKNWFLYNILLLS